MVDVLGLPLAGLGFRAFGPLFLRQHFAPFNALRTSLGLAPVQSLHEFYTLATLTLYADSPTLAPTEALPSNHRHIGPVLWEPEVDLPSWWHELAADVPVVYLSLGSSGDPRLGPLVLEALSTMKVRVMLATGGREAGPLSANVWAAPYLPGLAAARRSDLVISNGGSGTIAQAMSAGVPLLGIPSNADQYLCMGQVVSSGAGSLIRAGRLSAEAVRTQVARLLSPSYRAAAQAHRAELAAFDAAASFAQGLRDVSFEALSAEGDTQPQVRSLNSNPARLALKGCAR